MKLKIKYTNHYVAFVDVLGFKNILKNTKLITRYFNIVKNISENIMIPEYLKSFKSEIYSRVTSDSIIWAIPADNIKKLQVLCAWLAHFQSQCAIQGIWIRGGISRGPFYKEDNIAVGQALVDAYELEQNDAKYPRIILDPRIIAHQKYDRKQFFEQMGDLVFNITNSGELRSLKLQDSVFIDYLGYFLGDQDLKKRKELKKIISNLKKSLYSKQQFYEKHVWTKDYFLEVLSYGKNNNSSRIQKIVSQVDDL